MDRQAGLALEQARQMAGRNVQLKRKIVQPERLAEALHQQPLGRLDALAMLAHGGRPRLPLDRHDPAEALADRGLRERQAGLLDAHQVRAVRPREQLEQQPLQEVALRRADRMGRREAERLGGALDPRRVISGDHLAQDARAQDQRAAAIATAERMSRAVRNPRTVQHHGVGIDHEAPPLGLHHEGPDVGETEDVPRLAPIAGKLGTLRLAAPAGDPQAAGNKKPIDIDTGDEAGGLAGLGVKVVHAAKA